MRGSTDGAAGALRGTWGTWGLAGGLVVLVLAAVVVLGRLVDVRLTA